MPSVDNRVVSLKFDNNGFERKVSSTTSALGKLKEALKLQNGAKGFQDVDAASKKLSFDGIANGVETLKNKFSTLGVIGLTALTNITNKVVNLGLELGKAATIQPLISGLQEYETQINAVQTIMANTDSKGTTLKEVNAALDDLNTYADKTIYNFTEMTRNIGTFTAAGLDLNTSKAAIKGIANLGAASGSTSEQVSTAMYQLSQALSAGRVGLQDWNSVVNAGMGGELFRNQLLETARVHGIAVDQIIKDKGSFRDSLKEGWLTSDVLSETLMKFTGDLTADQLKSMGYTEQQIQGIQRMSTIANDAATKLKTFTQVKDNIKEVLQSGWATSFRIILGDFEEAKSFWTEFGGMMADAVQKSGDNRNKILQGWADLGGRTQVIDALRAGVSALSDVLRMVGAAWSGIFPPMTSQTLYDMTVKFREFMESLKPSPTTLGIIRNVFTSLFAVLDIGRMAIVAVASGIKSMFSAIFSGGSGLSETVSSITRFILSVRNTIKETGILQSIFSGVGTAIGFVISVIGNLISNIIKLGSTLGTSVVNEFKEAISGSGEAIDSFGNKAGEVKDKVVGFLNGVGEAISNAFSFLSSNSNFDLNTFFSGLTSLGLVGLIEMLRRFGNTIKEFKENFVGDALGLGGFSETLDAVRGSLEAYQNSLRAKMLLEIAAAIGILAISIKLLASINPQEMATALSGLTVIFAELLAFMALFNKFSLGSSTGIMRTSMALIPLSIAVLMLSAATKSLASLTWDQLIRGLTGLAATLTLLVLASKTLETDSKGMITSSLAMIVMAVAVKQLASAVEIFGKMDTGSLTQGLVAIGVVLAELVATMQLAGSKTGLFNAAGIYIMAAAVTELQSAVKSFGEMDTNSLIQGLVGVGVVLTELGLLSRFGGGSASFILSAVGIAIIASSLDQLAAAVDKFGNMDTGALAQGLIAMALALGAIVLALNLVPATSIIGSAAILLVATAMQTIGTVLQSFGGMSWEEVAKGLIMLAGSLTIITLALNLISPVGIVAAASIAIVAASLALMAPVLLAFGQMSIGEIAASLGMLAGVFTVIGVAGALLTPVIPSLLLLGTALLLMGAGAALAGTGILAVAAGLAILVGLGGGAVAAVGALFAALIAQIPVFFSALAAAIPQIATIVIGLIDAFIQGVTVNIPKILQAGLDLLLSFLGAIRDNIQKVVELAGDIIVNLLNGLSNKIPDIVKAAADLISSFLTSLGNEIPKIMDKGVDMVLKLLEGIANNVNKVVDKGYDIVIEFINKLADTIRTKAPELGKAGKNLISAIAEGLWTAVDELLGNIPSKLATVGKAIVDGIISGITTFASNLWKSVKDLASSAVDAIKDTLGIASPSKVFKEIGHFVGEGLIVGINDEQGRVENAARLTGENLHKAFNDVISATDFSDMNLDFNPEISPVVNLDEVKRGFAEMNTMFDKSPILNANMSNNIPNKVESATAKESAALGERNVTEIKFEQNNYSPKALSPIEIYRQTRNQISQLEGVLV